MTEPTGAVTRYATAWKGGDIETLIACYDEDVARGEGPE